MSRLSIEIQSKARLEEAQDDPHGGKATGLHRLRCSVPSSHDPQYAHAIAHRRASVCMRALQPEVHWQTITECKKSKQKLFYLFIGLLIETNSLQSHLKKHHPEEYMYECGMCSGRFKSEKWLRDHMEKKHGLEKDSKELIKVERVG